MLPRDDNAGFGEEIAPKAVDTWHEERDAGEICEECLLGNAEAEMLLCDVCNKV